MSRAYTPTSKVNACPICDNTSGKCRIKDDGGKEFILCMNFADSKFGEIINGYKCIKEASPNKSYFASTWTIDNSTEWTEQQRAEWERRKTERTEQQAREMAQRKRRSLSPVERDKGYRAILDQLELHPDDRANLTRRGFTPEQIKKCGFKSVQKYQQLKIAVNPLLPGVSNNGTKLLNSGDGYLIPVKNIHGLIVGCQIRLRIANGGRYRWLSGDNILPLFPSLNSQGENPIAIFKKEGTLLVILTEGTGVKPFLTSERFGCSVIGASGGQFLSSPELFREALEQLLQRDRWLTDPAVKIALDAGDILNPGKMLQWQALFNQLEEWKINPLILWWNQVTKDDCDIDELSDYSLIKSITPDEFFAIAKEAQKEAERAEKKAETSTPKTDLSTRSESERAREYLAALNPERADNHDSWIKVGIALRSVGDPYLLDDWIKWSRQSSNYKEGECERKWAGFKPGKLTLGSLHYWAVEDGWNPKSQENNHNQANYDEWAWNNWVKSRKFTPDKTTEEKYFTFGKIPEKDVIIIGKSGLGTGKTYEIIQQLKESGKGSRTIGFINSLLYQTNDRFLSAGLSSVYHLHGDDGFGLLSDKNAHISYCLPSIPHTAPSHYEEVDIILDEAVLVLKSAIEGNTLGDDQGYCLELLALALQHTDRAIAVDGNFRDIDVELLAKLAPNKKVIKYENTYKGDSHNITFIDGIDLEGEVKKKDRSPLIKVLLDKDVKPFIVTDSLERSKVLYQLLKEAGKKVKVLNSETSNEDWAKIFLSNPTKYLEEANLDGMIMSPSGCAGLDVWCDSFTHKFTFISGVLDINGITQMMFRLRNNIPHLVFCPEKAQTDNTSPSTYSCKKFQEQLDKYINQSAVLAAEGHISSRKIKEKLTETIERSDDKYWEYSARVGVLTRYEKNNLRRCLIWALENAGHKVEVDNWSIDSSITDKEKQVKEELQVLESQELYQVKPIPYEEAVKKARRGAASKEEIRQIDKAFLLHRLPGIEQSPVFTPEYILKNYIKDTDFISKNERFWMLLNYEVSRKRHEVDWYFYSEKQYFYKGMARKSHHSKVWALKELEIQKFFNGRFHKESPEVIELIERGNEPDIVLALGFAPGKPEPNEKHRIAYLRKLLDLIGIKLTEKGKETVGRQRIRVYEADMSALESPDRKATLEAIDRRFTEWMNSDKSKVKWEPKETIQPTGECPQTPIYYIQGGVADTSSVSLQASTESVSQAITSDSDIPHLAASLAAAGNLEGVRLLVAEYGLEGCLDAAVFAPIECRGQINQWLRQIQIEPVTPVEEAIAKVKTEAEVKPLVPVGSEVWILKGRWKGFSGKVDRIVSSIAVRCQITVAGFRSWVELAAGEFTTDWYEFKRCIG